MPTEVAWLWVEFVFAWWILFPAYAANIIPPVARGKRPIDGGRNWLDGRRIFGGHKTWEGFFAGVIFGSLIGLLEWWLQPQLNLFGAQWGVTLPAMGVAAAVAIPLGAMLGDLAGSFIKRRLRKESGADVPILDQLNFIVGAALIGGFFIKISVWMLLYMVIITPLIHRLTCIAGHKIKLKKVPW